MKYIKLAKVRSCADCGLLMGARQEAYRSGAARYCGFCGFARLQAAASGGAK